MKIGIFGDSFADGYQFNDSLTWIGILSKKFNITNYALGGTSLFWSIDLLRRFHLDYDLIIFVTTGPGRIKIDDSIVPNGLLDNHKQHIAGLANLSQLRESNKASTGSSKAFWDNAYNAAFSYFKYIHHIEKENFIHQLMVKELFNIRPDIITITGIKVEPYESCLKDVYEMENSAWDIDMKGINEKYVDKRNCHMTAKNNEILATMIEEYLVTDMTQPFKLNLTKFAKPTLIDKEHYLQKFTNE